MVIVGCTGGGADKASGDSYTIGITMIVDHPALTNTRDGFLEELAKEGFVVGENLTIVEDIAQGDPSIAQQIAQNFVAKNVDLIFAISTPSAAAAQNAVLDSDIPVIFGAITDPVGSKFSTEDGLGIGNITGVSDLAPVDKQLVMIRETLPESKKIGIVYNTSESNSLSIMKDVNELGPKHDFAIEEIGVKGADEVMGAVDALIAKDVDAIYTIQDNMVVDQLPAILEKTDAAKIPVFGSEYTQVEKGAVATEGIEYVALGREAGKMAAQILRGEKKASEIPFFSFSDSYTWVNQAAADAIGLKIPQAHLDRAIEVFTKLNR
jgi:putative ABC transport system substrate-binding protein